MVLQECWNCSTHFTGERCPNPECAEPPVRRDAQLPGEVFDGTLAETLGIIITDEMRTEYQAILDRITAMERPPMPDALWRISVAVDRPAAERRWIYNRLMVDVGHVVRRVTEGQEDQQ